MNQTGPPGEVAPPCSARRSLPGCAQNLWPSPQNSLPGALAIQPALSGPPVDSEGEALPAAPQAEPGPQRPVECQDTDDAEHQGERRPAHPVPSRPDDSDADRAD
jgi:hypothetical protein